MAEQRTCNGVYVFYLKDMYDMILADLAQYIGVMLVGEVVERFKVELSLAALCFRSGVRHAAASKYVETYLGKEGADQFVDLWSTWLANTFISGMTYLPDHTEEFDIVLKDDVLEVRVFQKTPPHPTLIEQAQRLIDDADENMDYVPESVRNALRRL